MRVSSSPRRLPVLGLKMSVYRMRGPDTPGGWPESRLTATPRRPARSTTVPLLISPELRASTRRIVDSTFGGTGCSMLRLASKMKRHTGSLHLGGSPALSWRATTVGSVDRRSSGNGRPTPDGIVKSSTIGPRVEPVTRSPPVARLRMTRPYPSGRVQASVTVGGGNVEVAVAPATRTARYQPAYFT